MRICDSNHSRCAHVSLGWYLGPWYFLVWNPRNSVHIVQGLIASLLDSCNSLWAGLPVPCWLHSNNITPVLRNPHHSLFHRELSPNFSVCYPEFFLFFLTFHDTLHLRTTPATPKYSQCLTFLFLGSWLQMECPSHTQGHLLKFYPSSKGQVNTNLCQIPSLDPLSRKKSFFIFHVLIWLLSVWCL